MKLSRIARFIKSNNAGAAYLTFDIGFSDAETFDRVCASAAIDARSVAQLYPVSPEQVRIFCYRPALVIKVTIPRPVLSGGIEERDFDGVQQFAPLLDLEVPEPG